MLEQESSPESSMTEAELAKVIDTCVREFIEELVKQGRYKRTRHGCIGRRHFLRTHAAELWVHLPINATVRAASSSSPRIRYLTVMIGGPRVSESKKLWELANQKEPHNTPSGGFWRYPVVVAFVANGTVDGDIEVAEAYSWAPYVREATIKRAFCDRLADMGIKVDENSALR